MAVQYDTIVVPGFGGSQLSFAGGKGGKTVLWYDPVAITKYTPLALALAADGVSPLAVVGKACFADGPVDFGIYEPLMTALANAGFKAFFWAYDWRKSANLLANQLAVFLQSGKVTPTFNVVAHSFGGLVAQLAYPLYKLGGPGPTWATTCYLGTPQGGAHWAGAALSGLFTEGSEILMLANLLKVFPTLQSVLKPIITAAAVGLGQLVGSWPGLYCLLPNPLTPWDTLDANASKFLQLATYANTPGGQQAQWLTLAAAVQGTLSAGWSGARPNEFALIGGDRQTLATLDNVAQPGVLASYGVTNDGDGTVITKRAINPPTHGIQFKRTNHTAIVNTLGPLSRLPALLKTPPTDFEVLPNNAAIPPQVPQTFSLDFPPVVAQPFVNLHLDP